MPRGFTRYTGPAKPWSFRLPKMLQDQRDLSVAPMRATERGLNSCRTWPWWPLASGVVIVGSPGIAGGGSATDLAKLHVALEQVARDRSALDLVGALEDAEQPQFAVPPLDRQFLRVAHPAVDLEHPVDHLVGHDGTGELGDRGCMPVVDAVLQLPGGVQCQPLDRLDLDVRVGDLPLDRLVVGNGVPHGHPVLGVLDRHAEHPLRGPDRPGGDHVAPVADPLHGEVEAVPELTEDVALRYPDVLEDQGGRPPFAHRGDRLRLPAHVPVDEEAGHAAVGALVRIGHGEDHDEVGLVAVGDEGLLAADHPVVAVLDGPGPDVAGIGPRPRLGDREATAALAVDRGNEVLLLLLLGARVEDVVGRAAEPERHERTAALHRDDRGHDRAEGDAAVLLRGVDAPPARGLGLALQLGQLPRLQRRQPGALVAQDLRLKRHDLLLDELADRVADGTLLLGQREVDHEWVLSSGVLARATRRSSDLLSSRAGMACGLTRLTVLVALSRVAPPSSR